VVKLTNGQLAYRSTPGAGSSGTVYNTISTPRGGQYTLELPDGSSVWLNAGSSLRFPTAFSGTNRMVQLTGEAYFEIAPHPSQPFVIAVFSNLPGRGDTLQKIKVLGTSFNVMAYADEPLVKTTLIDGAVRVEGHRQCTSLIPGEQAQWGQSTGMQVVTDADVDAAIAWKNGYFDFNKADIQTIMRQLSRWYDVEVSFSGNGRNDKIFFGGIQRDLPLSSVLSILERSGVKFSINGRKVVVDLY
jgi:ferric-dicitrate binding protein FerR (iron transport regulator)